VTISTYGSRGFDGREVRAGVSPCDPGGAAEEGDPVPSAQAHLPDDDADRREAGESGDQEHAILLEEIDDALRESAAVGDTHGAGAIATWRDSLTRILETLTYAGSVLADDVAILRHRLATDAPSSKEMVDDLPRALATSSSGQDSSAPEDRSDGAELDPAVFARSDALLAVHAEMASVDLTSAGDVRRVLAILEEQRAALTTRHVAVAARLEEIGGATRREGGGQAATSSNGPG
jgi:hypothetical protein